MTDFAAIDFETANGRRSSVCSVGIVIVRGGEIVDKFYSLIKAAPNYYMWFCQEVHGLSKRDTDSAPTFPEVWAKVEDKLEDLTLVAHNSPFDESCLEWNIPDMSFNALCKPRADASTFRATSSSILPQPVVTTLPTIIML